MYGQTGQSADQSTRAKKGTNPAPNSMFAPSFQTVEFIIILPSQPTFHATCKALVVPSFFLHFHRIHDGFGK